MKLMKAAIEKTISNTVDHKREESRAKILSVSKDLFYEYGYQKTTTRQILKKAGILNGSLYNTFANKEEIFKCIVMDALNKALLKVDKVMHEDANVVNAMILPVAIELYAASNDKRLAELIYEAHKSWDIVHNFITIVIDWASKHLPEQTEAFESETIQRNLILMCGSLEYAIGYYHFGEGTINYRIFINDLMTMFCSLFNIQITDSMEIVDRVCDKMESEEIVFYETESSN